MTLASSLETGHELRLELAPVLAAHACRPEEEQRAIERQKSFLRMRFARAVSTRR
jgi:hypothetical protein